MASTFNRVNFQVAVGVVSTTIDLVPRILATQRLVLSRIRVVNTKELGTRAYIFRIPPTGTAESEATAMLYGTPVRYGVPFDEHNIVLNAGEGIAVGALCSGIPGLVFTAFGELETITP